MNKFFKFRPRAREERGGVAMTVIVVALVIALNLILVYIGGAWGMYFQITDKQYYTLNGSTDAYFDVINPTRKSIRVYFCMSESSLNENYTFGRIYDTVRQFAERYDYITVEHKDIYYDYDDLSTFAETKVYNAETDEYEKQAINLDEQSVIVYCPDTGNSMVRSLSTFYVYDTEDETNNAMVFNGEEIMATMVARVTQTGDRPKAYFTTGHGEVSSTAMQNILYSAGYDILTADLSRNKIKDDCALIVISAPTYDFKEYEDKTVESEISRLRSFVARGGMVLVLRSPSAKELPRLDAFCASYGINVEHDAYLRDTDKSLGSNSAALLLRYADSGTANALRARAEVANGDDVVFGFTSPMTLNVGEGYTVEPVLQSYGTAKFYRADGTSGDVPREGAVVAAMSTVPGTGKTSGKVFVAGTSTLGEESLLDMGAYGNEGLLYALLEQTEEVTAPIGCGVIVLNTYPLADLHRSVANVYAIVLTIGIPLACGVAGFWVVRRRKNR